VRNDWDLVTPSRARATLVGLGGVLVGVTLVEMYLWWVVRSFFEISFAAGLLMSLPSAGFLVVGGYRLPRTAVPERYYPRLLAWMSGGAVLFGGFSVITGVTFFPEIPLAQVGSIRWGVSVGSGTGFLVGFLIARNVERRVAAERAAVRAAEAEDRREILEYLNALLRHEVLNTATVITGHADLLESTLHEDAAGREYTETIKRQADEISSVIDDVQFLLQASETDRSPESVDVRPVLETELRNLDDRHEAVKTELDAPLEAHVLADDLVRRMFANLLANAVEHNDSEPKRVSVSVARTPEEVTVDIEDNGPGIPDDEREGMFDPEVREKATHGLGLTIVARLVDRYGGNIELVETGADGTMFTVTLPPASSRPGDSQNDPETVTVGQRAISQ